MTDHPPLLELAIEGSKDIAESGEEPEPMMLLDAGDRGIGQVPMNHLPKDVWRSAGAVIFEDLDPEAMAFISASWVRTGPDGTTFDTLEKDPEASDCIMVFYQEKGENAELWICPYELDENEEVVEVGEFECYGDGTMTGRMLNLWEAEVPA